MRRIIISFLFVALVTSAGIAQKVGYVSTNELLLAMNEVKQANSKLETLEEQLAKQGDVMVKKAQNKLVKAQEEYSKGLLTAKDIARIESELIEEEKEIRKFSNNAQEDLAKKRNELFSPIFDSIDETIKAISAEEKISFVFDSSVGALLYASEDLDITDKVKARLSQ